MLALEDQVMLSMVIQMGACRWTLMTLDLDKQPDSPFDLHISSLLKCTK